MKVTATRDVFTLSELSPDARQKAIGLLRDDAWECLDSDMVSEDLAGQFVFYATGEHPGAISKKQLERDYGVRIWWSVAYCQSDHATIEGYLDRATTPKLSWPDGVNAIRVSERLGVQEVCVGDDYEWCCDAKQWDAARDMVRNLNGVLYKYARQACEGYTDEDYLLDVYENCYGLQRRFEADGSYAPTDFWQEVTA